jgi:hypothetical protein
MAAITYHPGTGVKDKSEFRLGKTRVPMSVITRLLKAVGGKTGSALDRVFYQGLAKYSDFLEAMEAGNLTPGDAVKLFTSLRPVKSGKLRIEREAEGVAKILAKKYSNLTPEEMVDRFVATANKPEFMAEVVGILKTYEKQFKRNSFGRIKTSGRVGNTKAIKALAEFRAKKIKSKK